MNDNFNGPEMNADESYDRRGGEFLVAYAIGLAVIIAVAIAVCWLWPRLGGSGA